jgi:hypothetical protein
LRDGTPFNLGTGAAAEWTPKDASGNTVFDLTIGNGGIAVVDGPGGKCLISLSAAQTGGGGAGTLQRSAALHRFRRASCRRSGSVRSTCVRERRSIDRRIARQLQWIAALPDQAALDRQVSEVAGYV